ARRPRRWRRSRPSAPTPRWWRSAAATPACPAVSDPRRPDPPLPGRVNHALHRAEPDQRAVRTGGGGADRDPVAVEQERAGGAVGQGDRLRPTPGELQQRPALVALRTADRARGVEVTGAQAGAVGGEVRQLLSRGPVEAGEGRLADPVTVDVDGH